VDDPNTRFGERLSQLSRVLGVGYIEDDVLQVFDVVLAVVEVGLLSSRFVSKIMRCRWNHVVGSC
jgi:hypothetical protein